MTFFHIVNHLANLDGNASPFLHSMSGQWKKFWDVMLRCKNANKCFLRYITHPSERMREREGGNARALHRVKARVYVSLIGHEK